MKLALRLIILLAALMCESAFAQDIFSPYYVVIGGFKSEVNAQHFCTYAHEQNLPAVYAYNEERGIFYVYVRATQTKEIAEDILTRIRQSTVFRDAWVFNGVLSGSDLMAKRSVAPSRLTEPERQPEPEPEPPVMVEAPEEKEAAVSAAPVNESVAPKVEAPAPVGKPFMFRLLNDETGSVVNGLVRLQESDKARQFRGFKGNETVYVPAPTNRAGRWVVVCNVLGYRQSRMTVDYDKVGEANGASVGQGDEVVIPIALKRVRKGDYVEMENVKFYNNAALFTPGSERELDELVAMMEENSDYEIRLHGHTNGDDARDIVSIGTSTDMFNPHNANAKTHSSSKELSALRADLVKMYLVSKGIDGARITTKGEGGKQMIFDPRGTLAGLNDRVEVEIRKH